ncbi:glycerol-3-phosphate dehydrogenase [Pseudoclavibacter sp. RFBJ3]|uniref:NAD(P)H-dependent glycerol-3-phosphate dehydrogenase n=1 Tax=unclassified Pseudoclavibacter TaxID=2615177 RepID=UPI000CE72F4D|nr:MULTISPECIES: NAD(P)H-dependent glycerol-3-phosphate dehydrogenase [unclassified Pseudoclavibacter]PPF37599.1 glycerol-3-phosphate dehydrogenase [Pseudoclavibacter sp. AY1H1]PPF77243.1 glycerol-3-phosphate dehydrogenase [Pseudoclavibacter sp. Z016]PPF80997.1 glycerol-3-phosphate dehydrogenase [Pseudoclavibacter sp. RFBJ5]PPF94505.1 glycerol-3-phosphate dehydrogenase [Pseudoclavibacter sp. RFBJ3]PPF99613.1 glycerol-3-phosphate dehydrogenase [Pseudoclavibacter sp. RFBH5]
MSSAQRAVVLGSGSWGTTFAKVLADAGHDVTLWARRTEVANEINESHRNTGYLPGIDLPRNLHATPDLVEAVRGQQFVFVSVPAQTARELSAQLAPHIEGDAVVVSLMKGVERASGLRMSEVLEGVLQIPAERVAVASGPNIALEIAKEQPTAIVVASASEATAVSVAKLARNDYLRSFVNVDVVGTEFGGVLKNLIAIAVGIVDGVGYGENTKASVMTRGLAEISDFAVAMGAQASTMIGLAGLGDLIATCESPLSRNFTAGRLLGQGYVYDDVVAQMQQTAEGLRSVGAILELAERHGVEMPIATQIDDVLHGRMSPADLAPHLATDEGPSGE